jgi:hypothetical protein
METSAKKTKSIPLVFAEFEEAKRLAIDLIAKHHPDLSMARIRYICRNKAAKKAGRSVPGNVYKMGGKYEYLVGCDFIIEIALQVWNDFNSNQRKAIVDHLLSRCIGEEQEDGTMKWRIRPPEVQEFPEVVERHGQWNNELIDMGKSIKHTFTAEEISGFMPSG